jgi:hypothetical protein
MNGSRAATGGVQVVDGLQSDAEILGELLNQISVPFGTTKFLIS